MTSRSDMMIHKIPITEQEAYENNWTLLQIEFIVHIAHKGNVISGQW